MPIGPARMPLLEHLGELRMRAVRIVACLAIGVCVFYLAAPTIAEILVWPISEYIPDQLFALDPFEPFGTRFTVAVWTAVVACSPVIFWQILAFFLPALKPRERRWFIPTFAVAVALFVFGAVFCYFVILNPAFQFLTSQAEGFGEVLPRMQSYIDVVIKFELGFGFAFELPLIVFYLVVFDVVPYKKLRSTWRGVYVALLVVSAVVTPDMSPVTMLLMFAALVALYEISLLVARLALRSRIKRQNERLAREAAEEEAEERAWQEERARRKRLDGKG